MKDAPELVVAEPWVDTDAYGRVIGASVEGARLFNLTVRGLTGRNLSLFFTSRDLIADGLQLLRHGHRECPQLETEYQPMERKRRVLRVRMRIADGDTVRWTFSEVLGEGTEPLTSTKRSRPVILAGRQDWYQAERELIAARHEEE